MADRATLLSQLEQGLAMLRIDNGDLPLCRFIDYLELLCRWNNAYNLTAVRDPAAMVAYHLLDSLSLLPYLTGRRCLDMGSGAGLPGLVLALAQPDRHWILLDSNAKKTRFLKHVCMQLGMATVEVVRERVDRYAPATLFDVVTARALADFETLCSWARPLLAPGGRLLAMKAAPDAAELGGLAGLAAGYRIHALAIPGIDGPRSLIEIRFDDQSADA